MASAISLIAWRNTGGATTVSEAPGSSGEVAELIWFLLSDYSDHISGTEVYIDGAQSLVQ